jgi:tRNA threonylcarbamoyladenosine biosynthesis protein TsaB
MTAVLGFDTATPDTVVGLLAGDAPPRELRHTPAPGERPGHASRLLPLARELLDDARLRFADLDRIAVGIGPGTFTGLRIGVATARALAQAAGAELAAVSTLQALAAAADHDGPVLAVLDARRGEAFAAAWRGEERLLAPVAVRPEALGGLVAGLPDNHGRGVVAGLPDKHGRGPAAGLPDNRGRGPAAGLPDNPGSWLAVGDGAVRFRGLLEPAGVTVPADGSPCHRVSAIAICRLAQASAPVARDALVPEYVRLPDAEEALRRQHR